MNQEDKFLWVLEEHKGILYKVANAYCKNIEDRKDLIQEIVIQLWKSFDNYNQQFAYATWIYRIALNVSISFYRKETSRKVISNPILETLPHYNESPFSDETEQDLNLLQQFIAELKELDRALMLLYLEEKNHKEIAAILGISETNVATKIGRIKTSLKIKFSQINN